VPVTRTDIIYLTSHLSGTVWVGYVLHPLSKRRCPLTEKPPAKHSLPQSRILRAPQLAGALGVGLARHVLHYRPAWGGGPKKEIKAALSLRYCCTSEGIVSYPRLIPRHLVTEAYFQDRI
jgi:hypothetical protein